jgi:molecular chaperone HscB
LHGVAIPGDLASCWLCRGAVAPATLFCDRCGAVQPWPDLDPFALFSLERRYDLDLDDLGRHYAQLQRQLAPERFAIKSAQEKALARHHLETLDSSYATLRDPVRRARCLLKLAGAVPPAADALPLSDEILAADPDDPACVHGPTLDDGRQPLDLSLLVRAVARAADAATLDRLANRMVREIETSLHTLSAAFRANRLGEAAAALVRLEHLERVSTEARSRRLAFLPTSPANPTLERS